MAINIKRFALLAVAAIATAVATSAENIIWFDGTSPVSYAIETKTDLVVGTAASMFASDMETVTGKPAVKNSSKATIRLTQLDKASKSQRKKLAAAGVPVESLDTLTDGFHISIDGKKILVVGSNGHGTAYGLLELSRMAGVSPWIWWGDMVPAKKDRLVIDSDFSTTQGASVEYRGVFLNDEDWSLRPWSYGTFEPAEPGTIGPKTYRKIFELLMRLRGNAVWGAMHEGTKAFFSNPANKLMADSCGIAVGSSHCEPLLRNNVGEWDVKKLGRYNYMTNRDAVHNYWIERLKEVKNSQGGNMFTIGMRGIHDGSMEGVKTPEEKFNGLQEVIDNQQKLIADYIGDPSKQMQVFVPYKEVLELYQMGLKVPEYVTLMWCDDNYGYITRLSDSDEQKRPGGGGVYYHLSYWGRPHDHLWLTTMQPGLIYNEMRTAYDHNVRKIWIANVHDPKVAAYDLEFFLDLAWDIDCVKSNAVGEHLNKWLRTNFGDAAGAKLYPVMREFYNLCGKRRPEFMGWNQVELSKQTFNRGLSPVANTEFSFSEFGNEADRYMDDFTDLASAIEEIEAEISPELRDAYFAAIKYPVTAAANHAVKILESQRARSLASGSSLIDPNTHNPKLMDAVAKSQQAYQNIRTLTHYYNTEMSDGKWESSMNMRPRDLPVFGAPNLPLALTDKEVCETLAKATKQPYHNIATDGVIARNAYSFDSHTGNIRIVDMLGHSGAAVAIDKGSSLSFKFSLENSITNSTLTTALIPTHPDGDGEVRYSVSIDGGEAIIFNLKEPFRSEPWKLNVLRGQALRKLTIPHLSAGEHTVTITAIDRHIVADQWLIDSDPGRKYYLIPVKNK